MRAALETYLKVIEAQAESGKLDNATFDAINKAVAAIGAWSAKARISG